MVRGPREDHLTAVDQPAPLQTQQRLLDEPRESGAPRWANSTAKLRKPFGASAGFTSEGEPMR